MERFEYQLETASANEETGDGKSEGINECCCEAQSDCDAGRVLIDGQVAWNGASAPARLPVPEQFKRPRVRMRYIPYVSHNQDTLDLRFYPALFSAEYRLSHLPCPGLVFRRKKQHCSAEDGNA